MTTDEIAKWAAEAAHSAADAAWLSGWSAFVTAIITFGLFVGALLAWQVAADTLDHAKRAQDQLRRDSIEQTRPYVYAQLVPGIAGLATWDLIITNTGKSIARNLTIECDAWPEKDDVVTGPLRKLFSSPQSLPPGTNIRTFWQLGIPAGHKDENGSTDPTGVVGRADITLHYSSDDPANPSYTDSFSVDPELFARAVPGPFTGPDPRTTLDEGEKDLHSMLAAVAHNIAEMRR